MILYVRPYVSATLFLNTGHLKTLVRNDKICLHLLQGLVGNGINAQLPLALCEAEPKLAPGRVPRSLTEKLGHGGAAVAGGEGGLVTVKRRVAARGC